MASVTVSVDATWRLSRVEFNTPHNLPGDIRGSGEVLLEEPETPSEGASILRGPPQTFGEEVPTKKVYGSMPGALVNRKLNDVMNESVEVDGKAILFTDVMIAIKAFMEKWRVEDENAPEVPVTTLGPVKGIPVSPVLGPIDALIVPPEQVAPPKPRDAPAPTPHE